MRVQPVIKAMVAYSHGLYSFTEELERPVLMSRFTAMGEGGSFPGEKGSGLHLPQPVKK
jgi:hypothetical protein